MMKKNTGIHAPARVQLLRGLAFVTFLEEFLRKGRENTVKLNSIELISSQQYILLLYHITYRKTY